MLCPRWVSTHPPIALADIVRYLSGLCGLEQALGRSFDAGGPRGDDVSRDDRDDRASSRPTSSDRRDSGPQPASSSYWLHLVTPGQRSRCPPIDRGTTHRDNRQESTLRELIPFQPTSFDDAGAHRAGRQPMNADIYRDAAQPPRPQPGRACAQADTSRDAEHLVDLGPLVAETNKEPGRIGAHPLVLGKRQNDPLAQSTSEHSHKTAPECPDYRRQQLRGLRSARSPSETEPRFPPDDKLDDPSRYPRRAGVTASAHPIPLHGLSDTPAVAPSSLRGTRTQRGGNR